MYQEGGLRHLRYDEGGLVPSLASNKGTSSSVFEANIDPRDIGSSLKAGGHAAFSCLCLVLCWEGCKVSEFGGRDAW